MALPSADLFMAGRVTNPNQSEFIRQRLYDYQLYPAAGAQQLTFFSTPVGQGVATAVGSVVGSSKTFQDTNMQLGGQLPSGVGYYIESIEVYFEPGSVSTANTFTPALNGSFNATDSATSQPLLAFQDSAQFYKSGLLEFNILQKNYLRETPLVVFPPKAFLNTQSAVASNAAATGLTAIGTVKADGRPYYVDPGITLQSAVNFEILLKWPASVPTISTFNGRVGIVLDGYMYRASQ